MELKTQNNAFAALGKPQRIWTVPAVHGDLPSLIKIHDALLERFKVGDRIVYHGNYTGYGEQSSACIDELLTFRRMVLSIPGVLPEDFSYLKGLQEEIWQELMCLPFAPEPSNNLLWMLGNGLSNTLYSYGLSPHDGIEACRTGAVGVTRWVNSVREAIRSHAGHSTFINQLQRAAFTDEDNAYPMLFVNAGLTPSKSLHDQGDDLWWAADAFDQIEQAYAPFEKVVRGFDPHQKGLHINGITATVDAGCGFGGQLVSVGFEQAGDVLEVLES